VYEVEKSVDAVQALAEKNGGYLARRDDRSITIRVPAGGFQGVVAEIEKLGDVLSRNVSSEDVTAEYRDLEIQLKNQEALRDRFQISRSCSRKRKRWKRRSRSNASSGG
jgi:hypothetical protein